jgi:uncharacterized protein with NRDE domain
MCLLAIAIGASVRWPLVIASNRDEFRDRPTLPLAVWTTPRNNTLLSGRDLRAGGTWMGSTPNGRIALLTNVREPEAAPAVLSRGELPLRWLEGQMNTADFLAATDAKSYGGCNLVIGNILTGDWAWASNRGNLEGGAAPMNSRLMASGWQSMALQPGIYGLSNALLDTPWPKTQALKAAMRVALSNAETDDDESALSRTLWSALANRQPANLNDLPVTGVTPWLEHALSSALIDMPERTHGGYGTLASTLMWVVKQPVTGVLNATICEKTIQTAGASDTQMVRLTWPLPG